MVFGLFKRKDPICGMKEEKGKGLSKDGRWFCNKSCADKYDKQLNSSAKKHDCCGH